MFCAETFLGSLLILFINIKTGMSIYFRLDCELLSHTFPAFGTPLGLNKMHCYGSQQSQMFVWRRSASWQHPFQLGKRVHSCRSSCIPAAAKSRSCSRRTGSLPSLPGWFQHFTALKREHLILCCLLSLWSSTVFRRPA